MLHQQLKNEMTAALKERNDVKLRTIRGLLTSIVNELVATNHKPDEILPDEDALRVISRAAKQRKDSIEQFQKGGRADLVEAEQAELAVIESYLPEMMSQAEIRKVAEAKKAELSIDDPAKRGQLMGAVMKELKGRADSADVKAVVDSLF